MARKNIALATLLDSIPAASLGGSPDEAHYYTVEVTTPGPSGTGKVTVSSHDGLDNKVAAIVTSGSAIPVGVHGGTLTLTFTGVLTTGDSWTVLTTATGEAALGYSPNNALRSLLPLSARANGALVISNDYCDPVSMGSITSAAPTYSTPLDVSGYFRHTIQLNIVGDTDIDWVVQSSLDGDNWVTEGSGNDATTSATRTSFDGKVKYVRFGGTAEHGTGSTIAGLYMGGN